MTGEGSGDAGYLSENISFKCISWARNIRIKIGVAHFHASLEQLILAKHAEREERVNAKHNISPRRAYLDRLLYDRVARVQALIRGFLTRVWHQRQQSICRRWKIARPHHHEASKKIQRLVRHVFMQKAFHQHYVEKLLHRIAAKKVARMEQRRRTLHSSIEDISQILKKTHRRKSTLVIELEKVEALLASSPIALDDAMREDGTHRVMFKSDIYSKFTADWPGDSVSDSAIISHDPIFLQTWLKSQIEEGQSFVRTTDCKVKLEHLQTDEYFTECAVKIQRWHRLHFKRRKMKCEKEVEASEKKKYGRRMLKIWPTWKNQRKISRSDINRLSKIEFLRPKRKRNEKLLPFFSVRGGKLVQKTLFRSCLGRNVPNKYSVQSDNAQHETSCFRDNTRRLSQCSIESFGKLPGTAKN